MQPVLAVLRALVDAAFRSGAISDLVHADLHGKLNDADPEVQAAPPPALTDAEQAEYDRLTAKAAAASAPAAGGDEGAGFGG